MKIDTQEEQEEEEKNEKIINANGKFIVQSLFYRL